MNDESDQRRRSIASAMGVSGVTATVNEAGGRYRNERERRAACIEALVRDAADQGHELLALERTTTTHCSAGHGG